MFVSIINESAFPKILIDRAVNALLSATSDILQSRLLPSHHCLPDCTRLRRIKGAGQLRWL